MMNARSALYICGIKPENVLLDADFSPKLADFGLAKLMDRQFSRALTTMRERKNNMVSCTRVDWRSSHNTRSRCVQLWMMLFEIIPSRRNSDLMENGTIRYLPVWATIRISEGDIPEILDHRLNNVNFQELERSCKLHAGAFRTMRLTGQPCGKYFNLAGHSRCQCSPRLVFLKQLLEGEFINS